MTHTEYIEILNTVNLNRLNRVLTCKLCNKMYAASNIVFYDNNLEEQENPNGTSLCHKCFQETYDKIEMIKSLPFDELPLHINEENKFVLNLIKERLTREFSMDDSKEEEKDEEEREEEQRKRDADQATQAMLNAAIIASTCI